MKATANDPVHELKAVLAEHLPWHGARIGFLAQFLLALFKVRSVNLAKLSTGFGGKDVYKRQTHLIPALAIKVKKNKPGRVQAALPLL